MQDSLVRTGQTSKAGGYSRDDKFSTIELHLCTKATGNLKGSLIVTARGISAEMRCSLRQSCSYDGTLCKALGCRHMEFLRVSRALCL